MSDADHMAHALALAARGLGRVWPNPAVGCVIVKGARVVGRGWTQPGGRPHAETVALAQAGELARGATAYVTLEPCAHHGKTPPCADALIAAGISRVVTALTDPDPRVSGHGHARLRAAGIDVIEGIGAQAATTLNAGFLKRVTRGLPMVTLKLATSLDGRIATASGESRWITGPEARRVTHAMRMAHDAVLVGAGTAVADDPDLTVRDMGAGHQPLRIVMDSALRHGPDSRLGRSARDVPVLMIHTGRASAAARAAWQATGAELIEIATENGRIDATTAIRTLAERGITRVFCEGGGTLAATLMGAGLVDRIAHFSAGLSLGADALPAIGPLHFAALGDAARPSIMGTRAIGPDTLTLWSF